MKKISIGILAHVDAGKTTLSEGMLYESGTIRKLGRVDNRDAFLDTYDLEKKRGITIFSKQAVIRTGDMEITLLDTPGHVDFSAETERALQVMDYAILVISAQEGVQAHTETIWKLLYDYEIPVFLFVNKMDQTEYSKEVLTIRLNKKLGGGIVDFSRDNADFYEKIAELDEEAMEEFFAADCLEKERIIQLISDRKLFPCFFGSALKTQGIREFLEGIETYTEPRIYPDTFGARIYKIARDEQGNRLSFLKVTGGSLKVKEVLTGDEKINQIRQYSGSRYETVTELQAGEIGAVTGPVSTYAGQGIGFEEDMEAPLLQPVLSYRVLLPEGMAAEAFLPKLRTLEEEEPLLHVLWDENSGEIHLELMGQVQMQILQSLVQERFQIHLDFDEGAILYKESIKTPAYGVGHFEPLRHYAEIHLLLSPLPNGSGLVFDTDCSEDILDKNWQRLALTHLGERQHKGVLTGSPITDMRISVVSGRAHNKHTEGGDFRQAVYRAVRQGLMSAESVLLEPYYEFRLQIPQELLGRAMMDLERMEARFRISENRDGRAELTGLGPVRLMRNYQGELIAYSKGQGKLQCAYAGHFPSRDQKELVEAMAYCPEEDLLNPSGSVFCQHGAGYFVPWDEVTEHMHMPFAVPEFAGRGNRQTAEEAVPGRNETEEHFIGTEEIDAILERAAGSNRRKDPLRKRRKYKETIKRVSKAEKKAGFPEKRLEYLLVDGYNIIHAWEELKELIPRGMDAARGRLMDLLCNYQAAKGCELIVVFDAYRLKGHETEIMDYHNIHVVYTKEAETADQYIEKFAHSNGAKYNITVATSDGMEQLIIRGEGCMLLSAREFLEELHRTDEANKEAFYEKNKEELFQANHVMKPLLCGVQIEENKE